MSAPDLLRDPISKLLPTLAGPSVIGIAAIILFQVVDTYFIGLIGTEELAAISFTFPVTFFIFNVLMGFGIGLAQVVGRRAGSEDVESARVITTDVAVIAFITYQY